MLYDYESTDCGYNFEPYENALRSCREINKVYLQAVEGECLGARLRVSSRSGAADVLGAPYSENVNLIQFLMDCECIWRESNDVALKTGQWRRHLSSVFGYMHIFREGNNSVPQRYIPSYNLEIETYESYRNDESTQEEVLNAIDSTTHPERPIGTADRIFDVFAEKTTIGTEPLLSHMHTHHRFTSAVNGLIPRVLWLNSINVISEDIVLSATDIEEEELSDIYERTNIQNGQII